MKVEINLHPSTNPDTWYFLRESVQADGFAPVRLERYTAYGESLDDGKVFAYFGGFTLGTVDTNAEMAVLTVREVSNNVLFCSQVAGKL